MQTTKITMETEKINDRISIINIRGEITAFAETPLMDAYNRVNTPALGHLVLDFSHLEYLNSSGIGLLITLLIRTNRQKQKLYATGLSEHYRRIFELTRLNEAIKIYPDIQSALAEAGLQ